MRCATVKLYSTISGSGKTTKRTYVFSPCQDAEADHFVVRYEVIYARTLNSDTHSFLRISHDSRSPVSQKVRRLLEEKARPASVTLKQHDDDAQATSPARRYLDEAASAVTIDPPFELEIVDRIKATPDQWRVIGSYLNRTRQSQIQELKEDQGPFIVDWDDGVVIRSEEEAKELVSRLSEGNYGRGSKADQTGSLCIII